MKNRINLVFAFLCIVFVLFTMSAPVFALATEQTLYRGDINQDGTVSAEDARRILRYAVRLEKLNGQQTDLADMDGDSQITACDARKALRTAVGLDEKKIFVDKHLPTDQFPLGKYVVSGTAPYSLKVNLQPGYGETITVIDDGTVLKVLNIVVWTQAEEESQIYWGRINWDGREAYVCMAYLEKVNITSEDFPLGRYVVSGTDPYGLKVKYSPGYGDAITMIYDDYEVEVLEIVEWAEADDEELRFWGKCIYNGEEAYVCMAYLEKID